MSELEIKLKLLGYKRRGNIWRKKVTDSFLDIFVIELIVTIDDIVGGIVANRSYISMQTQVTLLQYVYDVMLKDLEMLEC